MPETTCLHIQDHETGPIRVVELPWISVRVGRAGFCQVRLAGAGLADEVCRLQRVGRGWQIVPLVPAGSVVLQGLPVTAASPLPFDVPLRIGPHCLTLKQNRAAEPDWDLYRASPLAALREAKAHAAPPHHAPPLERDPYRSPMPEPARPSSVADAGPPSDRGPRPRPSRPAARADEPGNPWEARWKAAGAKLRTTPERPEPPAHASPMPARDRFQEVPLREAKVPRPRSTAVPATPPVPEPEMRGPASTPRPSTAAEPIRPAPRTDVEAASGPRAVPPQGVRPASSGLGKAGFFDPWPIAHDHPVVRTSFAGGTSEAWPTEALRPTPEPDRSTEEARPADDEAATVPTRPEEGRGGPPASEAPELSLADAGRPADAPARAEVHPPLEMAEAADAPTIARLAETGTRPETEPKTESILPEEPVSVLDPGTNPSPTHPAPGDLLGADTVADPRDRVAEVWVPGWSTYSEFGTFTWPEAPTPIVADTAVPRHALPAEPGPKPPIAESSEDRRGSTSDDEGPRRGGARGGMTAGDPGRSSTYMDLPSARDILAAHARARRQVAEQAEGPPARKDRASRPDRVTPTVPREPDHWSPPLWLAWPPATVAVLLLGATCGWLSWAWACDSYNASVVAHRLLVKASPTAKVRPLPPTLRAPEASWWRSTPLHLVQWGVYLAGRPPGDEEREEDPQALLDGALRIAPLHPLARLIRAQFGPRSPATNPLVQHLGLSRDAIGLAWSARALRTAGRREAAVRLYRQALWIACRPDMPRPTPLDFNEDPAVRRYLLPGESLAAPIVRSLIDDAEWPYKEWSQEILAGNPVAMLVTARMLHEQGRPEARELLERLALRDDRATADTGEGTRSGPERAIRAAAAAEALALASPTRWRDADQKYREAIELIEDDTLRRSWWFNLAEVASHLDDETLRQAALEAALPASGSDDISRRASDLQRGAAPRPGLRSNGTKAN